MSSRATRPGSTCRAQVTVSGGSFTVGTTTYTGVAADGTYRFGVFNERDPRLGGELGSDVNRDGNPAGSNGTFAVLWRTSDNKVFVDANADRSFAGEPAMTDYKVNRDKGYFGTDNPATAVKEAMPFVVQTDGKNKLVNIGIVSAAHGSHVAGIAAGNALFGGAMSGQAPGAKIVSLRACLFITGCTAAALTDGMIYVAKQSNVDVINMSIGGLPALNDGNNARALLYGRLIDQTNVQMFISAGNDGSGANTIGDPGLADKVMGIGSYISKASWQSNYGSDSQFTDNLHGFSSRGPREDGGFAPQLVAPGSAVSTVPTWQQGQPVAGHVHAAARLRHVQRHLDGVPGGSGLGCAADQRRQAGRGAEAARSDPRGAQVECPLSRHGPARHVRAGRRHHRRPGGVGPAEDEPQDGHDHLVRSGQHGALRLPRHARLGQGIYDREGVIVGQSYTRTYTFTRTSGGGGAVNYNLSWLGNDGTFSAPATISLAKNVPTQLVVTVNPTTFGIHSAVLRLDDPSRLGIEYETSNVVIAAEQFTAGNNYSVTKTGTIGRNQTRSFFFRVPAGTPAFKVDFSGPSATPGTGQARFLRFHPYGVAIDSNASTSCYSPPAAGRQLRRQPEQPHDLESAGGRLGDHDRGQAHVRRGGHPVHADGIDPRRDCLAESGHDRFRDDRRSDCPFVHADERVRDLHGPGGRHVARQRTARSVLDREPRAAAVRRRWSRRARRRFARRSAVRRIRPPTSISSSSTAPPAPACWPGRARTETPRSRSRSPTRQRVPG